MSIRRGQRDYGIRRNRVFELLEQRHLLTGESTGISLTFESAGSTSDDGDAFGSVLASGDFNADGYEDLAVGVPDRNPGDVTNAGAVVVFYGSRDGFTTAVDRITTDWMAGLSRTAGDAFGSSLAAADFNGDGFDDLAVGAPFYDTTTADNAGMVAVVYGSHIGLQRTDSRYFSQNWIDDVTNEPDDHFGWALATGDFDHDGHADLAIGTPDKDVGSAVDAGMVAIVYGSTTGLLGAGTQVLYAESAEDRTSETGDRFGYSLAAADFDSDTYDDLAIGAPYKDVGSAVDAGLIAAIYGSRTGLESSRSQSFSQNSIYGATNESGDYLGFSLTAGDFDGDGFKDLAIGAPGKDVGTSENAGLVAVLYASERGLRSDTDQMTQEDAYGNSAIGDGAGGSLVAGDFDGDGFDDLVVGIPYKDLTDASGTTQASSGALATFFGTSDGLDLDTDSAYRSYWTDEGYFDGADQAGDHFGYALAHGDFNGDGQIELAVGAPGDDVDGTYDAGAVYVKHLEPALPQLELETAIVMDRRTGEILGARFPDRQYPPASTTKIMTALLALEAVKRGELGIKNVITVSSEAAKYCVDHGCSNMGLLAGDRITLKHLLYGLLLPSGRDAAITIAEHYAEEVLGMTGASTAEKEAAFADAMNDRAAEADLSLTNTHFHNSGGANKDYSGNGAGEHYSSARDLAKLTRVALEIPLLKEIVASASADVRVNGNLVTLKNSNDLTGQRYGDWSIYGVKTGTSDIAGQNLVAAATDGCRDVITVVLGVERYSTSASRYTETKKLLDFAIDTSWNLCPVVTGADGEVVWFHDGTSADVQYHTPPELTLGGETRSDAYIGDQPAGISHDVDSFYVSVPEGWGGRYTFRAQPASGDVDPVMAVYDANTGEMLAFDDDSGLQENAAVIKLSLVEGKRYIVAVADDDRTGQGDVELRVEAPVAGTNWTPAIDDQGHARWDNAHLVEPIDSYFFELVAPIAADGQLDITVTPTTTSHRSSRLDADAVLFDAMGNVLDHAVSESVNSYETLSLSGVTPGESYFLTVLPRDYESSGYFNLDVKFGMHTGSIAGTVYEDANTSGVWDSDERALSAWTVYIDEDLDGQHDASEPSATSDTDGSYFFADLPLYGLNYVRVDMPAGWEYSDPVIGYHNEHLTLSQPDHADVDFGLYHLNRARGLVYEDQNANGRKDLGEPPIAGATVFVDLNGDGSHDLDEPSASSDVTGSFQINSIPVGVYNVLAQPVFDYYEITKPVAGSYEVTFGTDDLEIGLDFGMRQPTDFGDAPDSYGTSLAMDGAYHTIIPGFHLGAEVDNELDGAPTLDASGDDLKEDPDEDGIRFVTDLLPGTSAWIEVSVTGSGILDAWIDFNRDGEFDNGIERIFRSSGVAVFSSHTLSFTVPAGAVAGPSFARFRFSGGGVSQPTGFGYDGEVEDYQISIGTSDYSTLAPVTYSADVEKDESALSSTERVATESSEMSSPQRLGSLLSFSDAQVATRTTISSTDAENTASIDEVYRHIGTLETTLEPLFVPFGDEDELAELGSDPLHHVS